MFVRPAIAVDPREFGRGMNREKATTPAASRLGDDVRLFATTFLLGFVFVSAYLA